MVVMVTCKNCGHEYKSEVLQTADEETLRSEPHEDIMENCPKCNQVSSYNGSDFYWET
jgi:uncharacterized Zn finger protein